MRTDLEYRKHTRDEALEILRRHHAACVECDEADPAEITLDTKVYEWELPSEFSRAWVNNARVLNLLFEIDVPLSDWKPVLTPARERTLKGVCEFVAERATVPVIRPYSILGQKCRTAEAFLTVRAMLANAGADVDELRPSTALNDYATNGIPRVYMAVMRMAPKLLDRVRIRYPNDVIHMTLGALLFFATLVGGIITALTPFTGIPIAVVSFFAFLAVWRSSARRQSVPRSVEFDGLSTFRDLCRVLA